MLNSKHENMLPSQSRRHFRPGVCITGEARSFAQSDVRARLCHLLRELGNTTVVRMVIARQGSASCNGQRIRLGSSACRVMTDAYFSLPAAALQKEFPTVRSPCGATIVRLHLSTLLCPVTQASIILSNRSDCDQPLTSSHSCCRCVTQPNDACGISFNCGPSRHSECTGASWRCRAVASWTPAPTGQASIQRTLVPGSRCRAPSCNTSRSAAAPSTCYGATPPSPTLCASGPISLAPTPSLWRHSCALQHARLLLPALLDARATTSCSARAGKP